MALRASGTGMRSEGNRNGTEPGRRHRGHASREPSSNPLVDK